jgi:hypothetical protein
MVKVKTGVVTGGTGVVVAPTSLVKLKSGH